MGPSSDAALGLLTLFASSETSAAIQLLILALVYAWARTSATHPGSRPWSLAAGALLTGRAAWLAATLLGGAPLLLYILERFLTSLGVLLLGWAALSTGGRWKIDRVTTLLITLIALLLAASIVAPPAIDLPFNSSWVDFAWSAAGILLALVAAVGLLVARPRNWTLAAAGMVALIAGFTAHIVVGPPELSVPVFVRAGEVFGYTLLAVAAFRSDTVALPAPLLTVPATTPASHVGEVITTMAQATAVERPEDFVRLLTESVARAVRAEYCLLLTPPDPSGVFSIASGFDLIREEAVPGATLTRASCPALHDALVQKSILSLEADAETPDLRTLQRILELRITAPGLFMPMVADGQVQGGLLLLTPYSRRKWSESMTSTLMVAAGPMAVRLAVLRRPSPAPAPPPVAPPEPSPQIAAALQTARRRNDELEEEVSRLTRSAQAARAPEPGPTTEQARAWLAQQGEARRTVEILEAEISRLKDALENRQPSATAIEVQRLNRELALALQEIADLRSERSGPGSRPAEPRAAQPDIPWEELRQPLTAISGYAELLMAQPTGLLGTAQRKFVLRIREAVRKMEEVLDRLGAPGGITPAVVVEGSGPVDLLACIEEAMRAFGDALREKNLTFRLDAPEGLPAVVADKATLQRALASLLHNAALATRPGREILITLRAGRDAEAVALSISDAGEGIPAERLKDVFDRNSWSAMKGFPGLGRPGPVLAEARSLIEAQGGRVWVDSQPGVGTTFTVLLPIPRPSPAPAPA
ncbi:MAG TPA: HAMP domain-containing sensor histidine kinase [Anaerolineales bacterium]|nr:HAMP domain-containing sensor histidine kinase [Anaerolineales bacterium]